MSAEHTRDCTPGTGIGFFYTPGTGGISRVLHPGLGNYALNEYFYAVFFFRYVPDLHFFKKCQVRRSEKWGSTWNFLGTWKILEQICPEMVEIQREIGVKQRKAQNVRLRRAKRAKKHQTH